MNGYEMLKQAAMRARNFPPDIFDGLSPEDILCEMLAPETQGCDLSRTEKSGLAVLLWTSDDGYTVRATRFVVP